MRHIGENAISEESHTALSQASTALSTLITMVQKQYFRRQISKLMKQSSAKTTKSVSLQKNLILSICQILGINLKAKNKSSKKRLSKGKKRLKAKAPLNYVTRAELADVLAEKLYENIGAAMPLKDICSQEALKCPPVDLVSSLDFSENAKTNSRAGSSQSKSRQSWVYLHAWTMALCIAIRAENALKVASKELGEAEINFVV